MKISSNHPIIYSVLIAILISGCSASKKAKKAFERGEFQSSIKRYENILKRKSKDPVANFYIAEAYRQSNRASLSVPYYEKAIANGLNNDSVAFYYAYALKSSGQYDLASQQLDKFVASTSNQTYLKRANDEIQNISYLEELRSNKSYYRVKNMDKINTPAAEYSPVYEDGLLYFTSTRASTNKIYKATGTPFSNIYTVKTKGARIDSTTIQAMSDFINNHNINEGSVTFTPDGKTIVFARGNSGKKKGTADVDLYTSYFRNGQWGKPKRLNINKRDSWDSSPAFSRDGKTLYFASNRPGGLGGTDIYSARKKNRTRYGNVKNLGSTINTASNEMFPYVSDDGHMYFSSDGHPGFGGLDLFYAKRSNGKITVENMGEPINSNSDDFGLYLFKADRGFFTSNRAGGKGDDDIYTFVNSDPNLRIVNYFLRGITMTHNDKDSLVILPKTKVELLDYKSDILEDIVTGDDGKFLFRVYEHEHYQMIGENVGGKDQYLKTRLDFSTHGKSIPQEELTKLVTNVHFDTLIVLEKVEKDKIFVLENIYYDLDKWNIREDAAIELDKLVQILKDNPDIKIELSSHTDDRAPDDYNMDLSDKRAISAVQYIISQGISKDRLTARGYGETRLIFTNAKTEDEHQVNRRTEFKILEIGKSKSNTTKEGENEQEEEFDEDRFFDGE